MDQRSKELYQAIPSPIPAAIELLRHLFVSPSTIHMAPLSKPVIQRLQWIHPSLDDVNESYLYFNNMIDQGASGRIHQLRTEMIISGPPCWQVCHPDHVQFKVDENNLEPNGDLWEIFARVIVWKSHDFSSQAIIDPEKKIGIILKLEVDDDDEAEKLPKEEINCQNKKCSWKYFDLQDLITPGLDTRPWFSTLEAASEDNRRQAKKREEGKTTDEEKDYWAGYKSSSEESSSSSSSRRSISGENRSPSGYFNPILQARIQHTPLYRSKAPSVISSTDSIDLPRDSNHPGPHDLLSRISRTPLYKRAPSLDINPHFSIPNSTVMDRLFNAVGSHHPSSSQVQENQVAQDPDSIVPSQSMSHQQQGHVESKKTHSSLPVVPPTNSQSIHSFNNTHTRDSICSHTSLHELDQQLVNSLLSTFSFYKLSVHLTHQNQPHRAHSLNPLDEHDGLDFNLGERFVALAHRVVLDQSCQKPR